MNALIAKLQAWIPTLFSKKLGVLIMGAIAEFKTHPHQTPKQIAIAVIVTGYVLAQAYLDAKTVTVTTHNDVPGIANLPVGIDPAQPDQPA